MVRVKLYGGRGRSGRPPSVVGKLGVSLFFLFFFAMGSLFEALTLREFARAVGQQTWKETACAIVGSEVQERDDDDSPYAFTISYQYDYAGRTYTGSAYQRNYSAPDSYSDVQELVQKYPPGLSSFCYVNPGNPGEAVLQRDSLLFGLVLLFPLIFVVIGAGGIYATWRRQPPEEARPIAPVTAARRKGLGRCGLAGFFGVFAIVGGAMLYPFGIRPIARTLSAQSWVETPCSVLRAEVRSHDSDDGTTYSVYVLYEYEFGGQTYKNDRYDFIGGYSSGYEGKARAVAQYEAAERPVCYVNPKNPSESILKRGFHAKLLLALFPLPFLLVGVGGIVGTLRGKRPRSAGVEALGPAGQMGLGAPAGGRQVLKPACSSKMKFIGLTLAACFWNGIVSIFVIGAIQDLRHGGFSPSSLFLLLFIAAGLGLIAGAVYQFLAMFNPRPTIELSSGAIPLGGSAEVQWSFVGQAGRIRELAVTLRGTEEARYRRGTDTCTDRNVFYEMELHRTSDPFEVASGQVGFAMPQDTMHSFAATNNKIIWSLEIHGDIKGWPDVKESFNINVTPGTA